MTSSSVAVDLADRAMLRRAAAVREELRPFRSRGLLAIAESAPLLGVFLTARGIVFSFHGVEGEKSAFMARQLLDLSEAQWPAAAGLALGIVAWCCHRYLEECVDRFDLEMTSARLSLTAVLLRLPRCRACE